MSLRASEQSNYVRLLLRLALSHFVTADNAEDAFERVQAISPEKMDAALFHEAVALCLREGLIRDPIRIEEGALQCHWKLELTPKGVQLARKQD